jgi:uncharacterized membrane protein
VIGLRPWLWSLAAFAIAGAWPVAAHRGHDALTTVVIEADGRILVTHRLEASDIEPALAIIAPAAQANLDDPEAVAALVAYLGSRFRLSGDDRPIMLTPAGSQLGGAVVQFNFAGRAKQPPKVLTVTSQILTDVHPLQINQVNVRRGNTVQTLTFRRGGSQTVTTRPATAGPCASGSSC